MARSPVDWMAEPEEAVGPAVCLASDAASYVSDTTVLLDAGWTAWCC